MKKIVSLLFVSFVALFVTGCMGPNCIRQGWVGPSMELQAPDWKPGWHSLPPKLVPNTSLVYDSGYGYSYNHSRGENLSINTSRSYIGLPQVNVSRSTYDNTSESYSYTPVPPQMIVVPAHNYNAQGYVPLLPRRR